jgi:farnesyl diphosphate synthase
MAGGQDIDMQSANKKISVKKLEEMHQLKTGALLSAAVKLGALAANVSSLKELKHLDQFAQSIGLAFQIQDDILDIEGNAAKLGKNTGVDKKYNKATYPALIGLTKSKAKVKQLWEKAERSLQQLSADSEVLQMFVDHIKQREF